MTVGSMLTGCFLLSTPFIINHLSLVSYCFFSLLAVGLSPASVIASGHGQHSRLEGRNKVYVPINIYLFVCFFSKIPEHLNFKKITEYKNIY